MSVLGTLVVNINANTSSLDRGVASANRTLSGFGGTMGDVDRKSTGFFGTLGRMAGGVLNFGSKVGMLVFGLQGLTDVATRVVGGLFSVNMRAEETLIAFTKLTGSAQLAQEMMDKLWKFAEETPFEYESLVQTQIQLMGIGLTGEDALRMLKAIGDSVIGVGRGQPEIERVTRAFTQMIGKGRVSSEEMQQLAEAGLPAWRMLAEAMGITEAEARKLVETGKVNTNEIMPLLIAQMEKAYGGTMQKNASTMSAFLAGLHDRWAKLLELLMKPVFPIVKGWIETLYKTLGRPDVQAFITRIGEGLGGAISTVVNGISGLIGWVSKFSDLTRNASPLVYALAGALGALGAALIAVKISQFVNGLTATIDALKLLVSMNLFPALSTGAGGLLSTLVGFAATHPVILLVVGAIGALAGIFLVAYNTCKPFRDLVNNLASGAMNLLNGAMRAVAPLIESARQTLARFGDEIRAKLQPIIAAFVGWFRANWPLIQQIAKVVMDAIGVIWRTGWNVLIATLKGAWDILTGIVRVAWSILSGVIKIGLDILSGNWKGAWNSLKEMLRGVWEGIKGIVSGAWNGVLGIVRGLFSPIYEALKKPFGSFASAVGGIVKGAINGVIGIFNGGLRLIQGFVNAIGHGINKVAGLFGRGDMGNPLVNWRIFQIPYLAKGTRRWAGGYAVMGEEGPELAYLPQGASVIPAGPTKAMLGSLGTRVPGLAGGAGDWLAGGAEFVARKLLDLVPTPGFNGQLSALGGKMKDWLAGLVGGWVRGLFGGASPGGAGGKPLPLPYGAGYNVTGWIRSAMYLTGVPANWLGALYTIAMRESGGNPRAINLWDSNAKRGTPSKGLFQTIDPTFWAHHLDGLTDIWNPVHNAVAAIRYIQARYGNVFNVPGIRNMAAGKGYVGYALGGVLPEDIYGVGPSGMRYGLHAGETVVPRGAGGGDVTVQVYLDSDLIAEKTANKTVRKILVKTGRHTS